jgi:UPF0271 protein
MLASRKLPGAVIKDAVLVEDRLRELLETGEVVSIDGRRLPMEFETICVHGDTPGALEMVKTIRSILEKQGVALKPMRELL